jgi:hypothetical protein
MSASEWSHAMSLWKAAGQCSRVEQVINLEYYNCVPDFKLNHIS